MRFPASRRSNARRRTAVAFAVPLALAGCATPPAPGGDGTPPAQVGAPAAVAVILLPTPLASTFEAPYADRSQAFGAGATKAGVECLLWMIPAIGAAGPTLIFLGPAALALVAAPVAGVALAGGASAAATVPTEETAARLRQMAALVADELDVASFAPEIAAAANRYAGRRAEALDAAVLGPADATPAFHLLRERGLDAAVEVRVTRVGYASAGRVEAGVAMFLAAEARLVDAASGAPTRLRGLLYVSPAHAPEAWMRNGGELARIELAKARRTLVERVVDDLLLGAEAVFGPGSPAPRTCGLDPVHPAVAWSWTGNLRTFDSQPASTLAESVEPRLAWQPRPAPADPRSPSPWARAADVRYDLRIWNDVDGAPGEVVYERLGLTSTGHRVETPLAPKTTYYWSVRMRYAVDGAPRATRWSAANTPRLELPDPLTRLVYYSHVDGGRVVPRPCRAEDLDSCGCLDFIPARSYYRFRTP